MPDLKLRVKWSAYKRDYFDLHPFLPCYLSIIQEKKKALGSSSFNIKICTPRDSGVFLPQNVIQCLQRLTGAPRCLVSLDTSRHYMSLSISIRL